MPAEPIYFPVLDTGLVAQAPVQLSIQRRIPRAVFPDGSQVLSTVDCWRQYRWRLNYSHLSEAEQERFALFFQATARGAKEFVFPDPLGNLLRHSEDLSGAAWSRTPGLEIGPIEFIAGRTCWILTNSTSIVQRIEQLVAMPSDFALCFSVWAAWTSPQTFTLLAGASAAEKIETFEAFAPGRFSIAERPAGSAGAIRVGVEVPPSSQLIISSPQLEIGIKPHGYVATGAQSGVFTAARLSEQSILGFATSAVRRGLKIEVHGEQRI
jgi:hypothetical protein